MPRLVPQSASTLPPFEYLRMLMLGWSKVGKTTVAVTTLPRPVYVIVSDPGDALQPVLPIYKDFLYNHAESMEAMDACVQNAYQLAKSGEIKSVVWDTLSSFADLLIEECKDKCVTKSGELNVMAAWETYGTYLLNTVRRLIRIPAHVAVLSHYLDTTTQGDREKGVTKVAKIGQPGKDLIVPLIAGQTKNKIGSLFSEVVFLDKVGEQRRIYTSVAGVAGPGSRNMKGVTDMEADLGKFIEMAKAGAAAGG